MSEVPQTGPRKEPLVPKVDPLKEQPGIGPGTPKNPTEKNPAKPGNAPETPTSPDTKPNQIPPGPNTYRPDGKPVYPLPDPKVDESI